MSIRIDPPVWEPDLRELFKNHLKQQFMKGYKQGVTETNSIICSVVLEAIEKGADVATIKQFCEKQLEKKE